MRFHARYLRHTRAGIWYFRLAVPIALQPFIGSREVVRSLRTADRREAMLLSRHYAIEIGHLFLKLERVMARDELDALLASVRAGRTSSWTLRDAKTGIEISTKPGDAADHAQAMEALQLALASRGNEAPAAASRTPVPSHSRRLSELRPVLVSEKRELWSGATRIEYESALKEFEVRLGDVPIAEIDSRRVAEYTRYLREERKVTQRTIDKKLSPVAALFELAQRDGDYPPGDLPTKGHQRYRKQKKSRTDSDPTGWAFLAPDQLEKIFEPENLLSLKKPHEFWMPILGIYTGARIGELAQLYLEDIGVEKESGIGYVRFTDDREGMRLKSAASRRTIPLHPDLVALGFLDYLEDVRKSPGATRVFPYLRWTEKAGYGDVPSEGFARYLDGLGITDKKVVFHSFRKTMNQALKNAGVAQDHRCLFVGHDIDNVNEDVYSNSTSLSVLFDKVVNHYRVPQVDLGRLRYSRGRFAEILASEMKRSEAAGRHRAAKRGRHSPPVDPPTAA